jgi:hypothetical protein
MSSQLGFGTLLSFSSYLCDQLLLSSGTANVPNFKQSLRQCFIHKIVSKHPKRKNVSFLPFPVLMNTQPTNTTQKLYKRIMPFYNWTPKTPIPNNNKLPQMFMIYNHYYCWLCSQNLPLINIIRPWVGWELSMPLQFYTHQWT